MTDLDKAKGTEKRRKTGSPKTATDSKIVHPADKEDKITAVYMPPELCTVLLNQLRRRELSKDHMSKLVAFLGVEAPLIVDRTIKSGSHASHSLTKIPKSVMYPSSASKAFLMFT